jgi:hypothetical protein
MKVPIGGGEPTRLASGQEDPRGIMVDDGTLYWATMKGGTVVTMPTSGGDATVLADGQHSAYGLVIDESYVYWTVNKDQGAIAKVPRNGGATKTVAFGLNRPSIVAVSATALYYSEERAGTVATIPKGQ